MKRMRLYEEVASNVFVRIVWFICFHEEEEVWDAGRAGKRFGCACVLSFPFPLLLVIPGKGMRRRWFGLVWFVYD
jgi:hypothetical protein